MHRVDPAFTSNTSPMFIYTEGNSNLNRIPKIVLPILASLAGFVFLPFEIAIAFNAVVILGAFLCCECLDIRKIEQQYENRFMSVRPRMTGYPANEQKEASDFSSPEQKGPSARPIHVSTPLPFNNSVPPTRGVDTPRPVDSRTRGHSNPFVAVRPAFGTREREQADVRTTHARTTGIFEQVLGAPRPTPQLTPVPRPANVSASLRNAGFSNRGFAGAREHEQSGE